MKASELIAKLQWAVDVGADWDVVSEDGSEPNSITLVEPDLSDIENGAKSYIRLMRRERRLDSPSAS